VLNVEGEQQRAAPIWVAAAVVFALATAVGFYHVPTASAAFYEYVGHALIDGKTLYRDVWDNKLPSIYYLNALWQLAFGSRYVLHWAVEVVVLLTTVGLFATFARREGIALWGPATFIVAFFLSLPPLRHFNYTEPYATALIMLALVAAQRGAPIASALALTLAATFWLPAVFQAAPILVLCSDRAQRVRFLAAFLASAIVAAAAIVRVFGGAPILAGLADMYGWERVRWDRAFALFEARHVWGALNNTGLLVLVVFALGVLRRPANEAERVALVWLVSALLGAAISLEFSEHEFLPVVAPLAFAIVTYGEGRFSLARSAVFAVLIVALVARGPHMLATMRDEIAQEMNEARNSIAVGRVIARTVPKNRRLLVYGYASGIYLTSKREAAGRYPNHADTAGPASIRERARRAEYLAGVRGAAAIVTTQGAAFFPGMDRFVQTQFMPPCNVGANGFRVYFRRGLAGAASCPRGETARR
jgi:hypothetical protein